MSSPRSLLSVAISLRAIVLLSCLLSQISPAQSAVCYDGTISPNNEYYSCEPDEEFTSCCSPGDICFSNGLCAPSQAYKDVYPSKNYSIPFHWDACTYPPFKDPKCFIECYHAGGQGVQDCPEAGPNVYCCYGQSGCDCTDPDQLVTALPRSVVATLDLSGMVISNTPSISPPPTSTPSTTTVSTSTSTKTPQTQGSKSSAVPIGVGVGAGGAVLIAVTATAFFLRRRRRQNSPSLGPQLEYETKPDEVRHELMTISNTAELPTKTPVYELPAHR